MKKRFRVVLYIVLTMFILVGWGIKEVRLLDSSKLIDLNKAIALAKPGGSFGDSKEDSRTASENENEDGKQAEAHNNIDGVAKDIVIRVRDKQIYYSSGNGKEVSVSDTQLESRIRMDFVDGIEVTLVDDYAESHVYKSVREVLNNLKNDMNLTYKEDLSAGGR